MKATTNKIKNWTWYTGGYNAIHTWLSNNFGPATECINGCEDMPKYEWALIQGKKYEHKKENFQQMCGSCHKNYDMTEKEKQRLRENGYKIRALSPEEVDFVRDAYKSGQTQKSLAQRFGIHQSTISLLVNNKTYA